MLAVSIARKVLEREIPHSLPPDADVGVFRPGDGLYVGLSLLGEALAADNQFEAFATESLFPPLAGLPSGDKIRSCDLSFRASR